jgi:hypothetical protein
MSRATWYRLGKPSTKPRRITQAEIARRFQISVRGMQRAGRVARAAPDLVPEVESGKLRLGTAERMAIERDQAAVIAYLRSLDEDS